MSCMAYLEPSFVRLWSCCSAFPHGGLRVLLLGLRALCSSTSITASLSSSCSSMSCNPKHCRMASTRLHAPLHRQDSTMQPKHFAPLALQELTSKCNLRQGLVHTILPWFLEAQFSSNALNWQWLQPV